MFKVKDLMVSRLNADNKLGHGVAHQLQMDLLRAHLRLSAADLLDPNVGDKHHRVNTVSTIWVNYRQEILLLAVSTVFLVHYGLSKKRYPP